MKKAIIIYDTKFGNTEKIAIALLNSLKAEKVEVDCSKVGEIDITKLVEYDLLAFGAPTHAFRISKPMKRFLEELKKVDLTDKKAFAFDTKFKSRWAGSASKNIEKRLKKLGMKIIKSYSSAIVTGNKGPLEEGMAEKFKEIGIELSKVI